jgi:uncharacterized protein YbcI
VLGSEQEQLTGGQLNAAIANSVVQIHNQYLGRGPSKGQAFHRDNVVVVLMRETLTKAERSLAESGRKDHVLNMRQEFQRTMEGDLSGAIEELTGCKVLAFMSDNHVAPDMAAELFVLDRPVPQAPAGDNGAAEPGGGADRG